MLIRKHTMRRRRKKISVPMDEVFPITDEDKLYWQLLGRMVDKVTLAEEILNLVALKYTKVDLPMARAILFPLRIDAATNILHKIIETKHLKATQIEELKCILQQLGQINRVRNDLLHLGGFSTERAKWETTNFLFARSIHKIRKTQLDERTFEEIDLDLHEISFRLLAQAGLLRPNPKGPEVEEIIKRSLKMTFKTSPQIAWRYKPQSQPPRQQETRTNP